VAILLRGAPHAPQAKGLFSYLFRTESAWVLGQNDCALVTLLPNVPRPDWVPALGGLNVAQVDPEAAWKVYRANAPYFSSWGAEQGPTAAPPIQPRAALDPAPRP